MLFLLNLLTPKHAFIEFRLMAMRGTKGVYLVLDATLYAWPEQWRGEQGEKLDKLQQQLEDMRKEVLGATVRNEVMLKKHARDLAKALSDRGLKGEWKEGDAAVDNRKRAMTKPITYARGS